ncbi:MAG: extracellular solute-binding protein [Rhodobacteraceae bacterium]|nr:extracellular solute-binding protein [Paracoccaceae bacterium]
MKARLAMAGAAKSGLAAVAALAFMGTFAAQASQNIITSHGISKFGELKYAEDFQHLEYVNPDAPKGGEISIWAQGTFDSMNPYTRKGRAGALSSIFFESLLTGTADEVSSVYGLLAERLTYPEDRSWVIFDIRPEARFSDGTPVTAEDVLFSYEIFLEQGLLSYREELQQVVVSAEILEPLKIRFEFNTERSTLTYPSMIGGIPIFSKHWFEETGAQLDESRMQPAVGSSPYLLDEFETNRRIIYRRNPDYWGAGLPINRGQNNFDRIRVEYFADTSAAFEGFKAGVYTFRNENFSLNWATGYDFPALDKGWVTKRVYPDGTPAGGQCFVFNLRREQFQDPRVREAISLLFNFEWSNETLFYGLYARIHSFWENSDLAATELPGAEELALLEPLRGMIPDEVFTEPAVLAPSSGERKLDRGNLRQASDLLDEAGWVIGDDGIRRNAEGKTLQVEFLGQSPSFDRIINPFVENLRATGIDAIYTRIDPAQYTNRSRDHDFDIITSGFPVSLEPAASGLRQMFGSEHIDGVFNDAGLASEAVDRLIDHVQEAGNLAELRIAVKALDRVLRAERFWVPQWFKAVHTVAYFDQYEHPENLPPFSLGQLSFWWFNPEKHARLVEEGAF